MCIYLHRDVVEAITVVDYLLSVLVYSDSFQVSLFSESAVVVNQLYLAMDIHTLICSILYSQCWVVCCAVVVNTSLWLLPLFAAITYWGSL